MMGLMRSGEPRRWLLIAVLVLTGGLLPGLSTSTNYTTGCDWLALDGGVVFGDGHIAVDLLTATGLEGGLHGSANYSVDTIGCLDFQVTTGVSTDVWNVYR